MSSSSWRDHYLTDIIEAELILLIHLMAALEAAGFLSRAAMARVLRAARAGPAPRPGVTACLESFAALLEQPPTAPPPAGRPGTRWQPRLIDGGCPAPPSAGSADANAWRPHLVDKEEQEEGEEPGPA